MTVRFFRSRGFEIVFPDPRDGRRRGFFFELILGLEAPVDPRSGMTVNLARVEEWLDSALGPRANPRVREVAGAWAGIETQWVFFEDAASRAGARLRRLEWRGDESSSAREAGAIERSFARTVFRAEDGIERPRRARVILTAPVGAGPLADPGGAVLDRLFAGESVPAGGWSATRFELASPDGARAAIHAF